MFDMHYLFAFHHWEFERMNCDLQFSFQVQMVCERGQSSTLYSRRGNTMQAAQQRPLRQMIIVLSHYQHDITIEFLEIKKNVQKLFEDIGWKKIYEESWLLILH